MALTTFLRFGSRRPKVPADVFDILGDLVPWQESVDASAAKVTQTGLRNRIINGGFRVNQAGYVSGTALAVGAYSFDMWKSTTLNTALTFTAEPNGTTVTISSGGSIAEVIEREGMPAGMHLVSWTGTATGRVYNSGAAAPAYAASPIAVTLDGLADVVVEFTAVGGTKTLTKVQTEGGATISDVTPFEVRPFGMELSLCQRYYWRSSSEVGVKNIAPGMTIGASSGYILIPFPVTMRAIPTFAISTATDFQVIDQTGAAQGLNAFSVAELSTTTARVTFNCATYAGFAAGMATIARFPGTAGRYFELNARL